MTDSFHNLFNSNYLDVLTTKKKPVLQVDEKARKGEEERGEEEEDGEAERPGPSTVNVRYKQNMQYREKRSSFELHITEYEVVTSRRKSP